MKRERPTYRCSFCGKTQDQVRRLIAGPGAVYICNECIMLCTEIIAEEQMRLLGQPLVERARAIAAQYPADGDVHELITLLLGELTAAREANDRLRRVIDEQTARVRALEEGRD